MLETVDFAQEKLFREDYKPVRDELIERLVLLQQQARAEGIGLVVLLEGWGGAGKGSRLSDLMYNLDARATSVHVTADFDAEAARTFAGSSWGVTGFYPVMQEFWKALGERGTITFFDRGWYTAAIEQELFRRYGDLSDHEVDLERARAREELAEGAAGFEARRAMTSDPVGSYRRYAYDFERMLVDDGYAVVKLFVHVRNEVRRKRVERLYNNPETRWRVSRAKLDQIKDYEKAYELYDLLLEGSNFDFAPWTLVNGEDKRAANIQIARTLVEAIEDALERARIGREPEGDAFGAGGSDVPPSSSWTTSCVKSEGDAFGAGGSDVGKAELQSGASLRPMNELQPASNLQPADGPQLAGGPQPADGPQPSGSQQAASAVERAALQSAFAPATSRFAPSPVRPHIDHALPMPRIDAKEAYRAELALEQKRLYNLELELYQKRVPLMIMYEGWDAAGKGGNIKRVAQALDARAYTVFPSPAPTKPELLHPHLWRYWTRLPKAGHVGIYDRSWYGRVLVERVEELTPPAAWARAYDEINAFEYELVQWGAILLKFWVDVSPDEQLRRFREREANEAKRWKITPDDWRNRDKYPQYKAAVDDMFRLTSTAFAPWIVLESDDKRFARVEALKAVNAALEARLRP